MEMLEKFGVGWFDFVVVGALLAGFFRGRKRGMSVEMLDVLQWLLIVTVGALYYKPVGAFISDFTHADRLWGNILAYLSIAVALKLLFKGMKKASGDKLVGSDLFGRTEFYFGMMAGTLRYACIVLAAMALVNARAFSGTTIKEKAARQEADLGKVYFPPYEMIQQDVLYKSFAGKMATEKLKDLLIEPSKASADGDTIARRREREVDEVMGRPAPPK